MEYVIAHTTKPTHLTLSLPGEVAQRIGLAVAATEKVEGGRSISFLSRGPGIARVMTTHSAREALAIETVRGRLIASARPSGVLGFTFPVRLARYLQLDLTPRPGRPRGTDDTILWIVPAPEYYDFHRPASDREGPDHPRSPGSSHVYLAKSLVPLPKELSHLAETEARIEQEEWRPGVEALQRLERVRPA